MISIEKIKHDFGKEIALVILCCRVHFKKAAIQQVNDFITEFDINYKLFLKLCTIHRVRPVVFKIILQAKISAELSTIIKQQYSSLTKKSWLHAVETERITALLKRDSVTATAYKGAAFSKQFYHDLSSRESSDIDLVIQKNDLDAIIGILEKDGYLSELKDIREYLGDKYFYYYKDYSLNKFAGGKRLFHIDMHWSIAENHFNLSKSSNNLIYDKTEKIVLLTNNIETIDKTSHFLSVFIHHAIKDTFQNLKVLLDIAQCFTDEASSINWEEVNLTVDNLQLNKSFNLSIVLAEQLFGVQLSIYKNASVDYKLNQHFLKQLCADTLIYLKDKKGKDLIYNQLLVRNNLKSKMQFSINYIKYLFSPMHPDFRLFHLPRYLFFMYPFLKPFRFIYNDWIIRAPERN
jgi:hypothetical protein